MTTTSTHSENIDTAYALLAEGECQIAAGQYREGSASVYEAAFTALQAVAKSRGWPCETEEDVCNATYRLDGKEPPASLSDAIKRGLEASADDPLPVYGLLFSTVTCFKLHGETVFRDGVSLPVYFWEPEDYVKSLPLVRKFIDLLVSENLAETVHEP